MNSAIRAKIGTQAEKNGYAIDVIEAMVDKSKTLERDGKTICAEGEILTLTDIEAATKYGDDQTPLLSSGTIESIDALIEKLGYAARNGWTSSRWGRRSLAPGSPQSARCCF